MGEYIKFEKASLLVLSILCKILGIAMICFYIKEQITILLPIGALTFFIPSFGCGGTIFESRGLLLTYSSLLLSFLLSQLVLLMYYIMGEISPQNHKTDVELQFHKLSTEEWVFLHTTAVLEIIAAITSFRLANKLKQASNDYDQFENEESDDRIKILSRTVQDHENDDNAQILSTTLQFSEGNI